MTEMTAVEPFASEFEYTFTVTEKRVVMVPTGPSRVIISEFDSADAGVSAVSPEHYPHVERMEVETDVGTHERWKPVDTVAPEKSKHVNLEERKIRRRKTRCDGGAYNLFLRLVRQGELVHYGFETEDGPEIRSARSVSEFLAGKVKIPYRTESGRTRTSSYGPFIDEVPSDREVRAMQMLINGHTQKTGGAPSPRVVLGIVEAVVENDMERLNGYVNDLMTPFMDSEWVKIPLEEQDDDQVPLIRSVTPESRRKVKQQFTLTLEGADA